LLLDSATFSRKDGNEDENNERALYLNFINFISYAGLNYF